MAKKKTKWMQGAVKRPGAFTSFCKSKGFGGVTEDCISYALKHGSPRQKHQALFAKNAKAISRKGRKKNA